VYLKHLSLTNYRNYRRLEMDFPRPLTVLHGGNAQGKTNLLEAIFFLATSRAPQARADRQLIHWDAAGEPLPFARLVADLEAGQHPLRLELTVAPISASNGTLSFRKQIRVNGVPRRALDLVGEMKVVLFLPQDIDLVAGSPAGRRHFLDVALCQIDRDYCTHLSHYQQVITRRNHLLRQLQERGGDGEQLRFWDEQAALHAGHIVARRRRAVENLARQAGSIHGELTGGTEQLNCEYMIALWPGRDRLRPVPSEPAAIRDAFLGRWRETRAREIASGATLIGPHRDDLLLSIYGHDLQQFGSRGQQRTAAMALKLAEVELMTSETGETPLLLLDDVMSELDQRRRHYLARRLDSARQAIVTTTELSDFEPAFLQRAAVWRVMEGRLLPAEETHNDQEYPGAAWPKPQPVGPA
jgi:DNA replication and repair protein RecF